MCATEKLSREVVEGTVHIAEAGAAIRAVERRMNFSVTSGGQIPRTGKVYGDTGVEIE